MVSQDAQAADLSAACDDAAFLIAAGRAREARGRLESALLLAGQAHPLRARAESLVDAARSAESRDLSQAASTARLDSATEAESRIALITTAKASQRAERLARIRDLQARGHGELALATVRTLLHDLPGDEEVEELFRLLLDQTHAARTTAIAERQRVLRAEVALQVERSLIPEGFDGQPMYPSDWAQRRTGRNALLETSDEIPVWQRTITDRLMARVTIGFDGKPIGEAIQAISQLSGVNILASPELLAAADRLVTLSAVNMRLEDVLSWIAEQAGTRWTLSDGAVFVGDKARAATTIAIHDVSELLLDTQDYPGLHLDLSASSANGGKASSFTLPVTTEKIRVTADDVVDLIRRTVSPQLWQLEGHGIKVRGTTLLVTAPAEEQRLIREFLRAQSAQNSLSVRVDAKWLELYDRFVEEIGVSWTSGPTQMIDPGVGNRGGLNRSVDGWAVDGSTTNQLPGTSMSIQPSTAGSGLTLQGALLGSSKLSAVLSAVERSAQGRVLQAPELTCLNGQQANAFFGNQIAYISGYGIGAGGSTQGSVYDPVISVLNIGAMIEVRPLISADRKFVVLELRTALSTATLYTDSVTAAGTGANGEDTNGDGVPDTADAAGKVYPIELPNVAIRTAGTTVTLPDRGSLLVGGFNASLDQFSNTRVPMLGSVPFLGRLFGARGRYTNQSKLYLLTTATIINYPELEARL